MLRRLNLKNNSKIDDKSDTPAPIPKLDTSIMKTIKEQIIKKNKDKIEKMLNDLNQGKY